MKHLKHNGVIVDDNKEIADLFNSFYNSIGNKLSSEIPDSMVNLESINNNTKSMFFRASNSAEISKIINDMGLKSGGVDGINIKTTKVLRPYIINPLAYIFNLCISKGFWPEDLKKVQIIPIYKSGEKFLMTNYRPISLISNLAKIFEKIVFKIFGPKSFRYTQIKDVRKRIYYIGA